jgi:CheY-like chemotaxis protein
MFKVYDDLQLAGEAESGEAAIELVAEVMPDVILMDMSLPGMDGATATRAIRQRYPQIQVIALTSFKEGAVIKKALEAGAIGYLLKDISADDLVWAIRSAHAGRATLSPEAAQVLVESANQPPAPGLDPGQFFGPLFSDDEVAVGDTWTDEVETPGMGDEPVVTTVTNTITGIEEFDGAQVYVIDTTSTTSPIEFDLGEFFRGLFGAFAPEGATPEDTAEFEELMSQLKFQITVDDTTADGTTRFDAEAGVARQSEINAATHVAMDMMIPDDTTGEMIAFQMAMAIDQVVTYHLIAGPQA